MTMQQSVRKPANQLVADPNYWGAKILVVDDNDDLLKLMGLRLKSLKFELEFASSGEAALSTLEHFSADLVITDLKMPGISGIELFSHIHSKNPLTPVILLTAHGTIAEAVEATQAGVAAYLSKPFDSIELLEKIHQALTATGYRAPSQGDNGDTLKLCSSLLFKSAKMQALLSQTKIHATTTNLILIEGEPGTGKDQLADIIHQLSTYKDQQLRHISCTSLPRNVIVKELFGFVGEGSYDQPDIPGLLRSAVKTTLLISDYEQATDDMVQKVLSAIINGYSTHLDGGPQYPVKVRLIATTNINVGSNQRSQKIVSDTQTLNATVLRIPSLSERPEDIPVIANHSLSIYADKPDMRFSNKAIQTLLQSTWPGNARHLLNVVQQCARLSPTKVVSERLVRSRLNNPIHEIPPLSTAQRQFERDYLTNILKLTNGNVTKAAEIAKRNRTEFHRLLKKHRIEAQSFRTG